MWVFYLRDCVTLREINKVDLLKVCVCVYMCVLEALVDLLVLLVCLKVSLDILKFGPVRGGGMK